MFPAELTGLGVWLWSGGNRENMGMNPRSLPRTLQKLNTLLVLSRVNGLQDESMLKKKKTNGCVWGGQGQVGSSKADNKISHGKKKVLFSKYILVSHL